MTKEISIGYPRQRKEIKITFPGGMVNIQTGLTDDEGRAVAHVSVTADGDRFALAGDPAWWARWSKVDKGGGGCRIIRAGK